MSTLRVTNLKGGSAGSAPNLPDGANITGVVTATSFSGSGANLTGIDATALKDGSGNVKIQANSDGAVVTGVLTAPTVSGTTGSFTGNVSVGGTLTYEDVTNVDSVGVVTARNGIKVTTGGIEVAAGGIDIAGGGINVAGVSTFAGATFSGDVSSGGLDISGGGDGTIGTLTLAKGNNSSKVSKIVGTSINTNEKGLDILTYSYSPKTAIRVNAAGAVGINTVNVNTTLHLQGNYGENIVPVTGTAVNCSLGNYFTKTITGATTFTFTGVPSNVAYAFTFEVTLNGSNAITWPASVKWPADTAPTITDGKTQVFVFLTDDGGTRWRGSSLVDYTN